MNRQRSQAVDGEVQKLVAQRGIAAEGEVHSVGGQHQRRVHRIGRICGKSRGIVEKTRYLAQIADVGIVQQRMAIVVVEAAVECRGRG